MDWGNIITTAVGFIAGGGLTVLITLGAQKKKANAEAEGVEEANSAAAVETLTKAIEQMSKANDNYAAQLSHLNAELAGSHDIIHAKDESIATLQTLLCKHMGCSLREPVSGQGRKWFEDNKEDISLGLDYLPINQLMTRYGAKKKKEDAKND